MSNSNFVCNVLETTAISEDDLINSQLPLSGIRAGIPVEPVVGK